MITKENKIKIYKAGKLARTIKAVLINLIESRETSAYEIDQLVNEYARHKLNYRPAFMNYKGYAHSVCVSKESVALHGVPDKSIRLKTGEIVTVDLGIEYKKYKTDTAFSVIVGSKNLVINDEFVRRRKLIDAAYKALFCGLAVVKNGATVGDITTAIDSVIQQNGYWSPSIYGGHGIGLLLHSKPFIPNNIQALNNPFVASYRLTTGMIVCIEPILLERKDTLITLEDGWTVKARSNYNLSAHVEETIEVTEDGYIVIT